PADTNGFIAPYIAAPVQEVCFESKRFTVRGTAGLFSQPPADDGKIARRCRDIQLQCIAGFADYESRAQDLDLGAGGRLDVEHRSQFTERMVAAFALVLLDLDQRIALIYR